VKKRKQDGNQEREKEMPLGFLQVTLHNYIDGQYTLKKKG
jgi:hypothetical protein